MRVSLGRGAVTKAFMDSVGRAELLHCDCDGDCDCDKGTRPNT